VGNLADYIEKYLKLMLRQSRGDVVEFRRNELAGRLNCVPSQINYVLETRFTAERGYIIESRRGGGGYIRIIRVPVEAGRGIAGVLQHIGEEISQERAEHCIDRLLDEGLITRREQELLRAAVQREAIRLRLPLRDIVRADLLRNMLLHLWRQAAGSGT